MRVKKAVLGLSMIGALLLATTVAFGATPHTTPAGGAVRVWVTPGSGSKGKIVVTGAIGDYGTTTNITKSGKPSANGAYVKIKLHQGTFEVNAVALNKKLNNLKPNVNGTTCSFSATAAAPVTLFNGTGLYAGISGKIKIVASFAFIGSRTASGMCNQNMNAKSLAQYQSIQGAGNVSFS